MDLFIDRTELARTLASIQGVVERRSATPVLSHVLLHGSGNTLRLTATDHEVAFIGEVQSTVEAAGDLAVDAASLFQVVRALDAQTVQLRLGSGQRLEIKAGRSHFRLPSLPADEYPALPAFDARGRAMVRSADLQRLIDQVSFAIATDDARYGLNGAHLEEAGPERVRFVATDGHRLSVSEAPFEGELVLPPRMLFPRKALNVLRKLLDGGDTSIELSFGESAVQVTRPEQRLWFRLLDGEFPDYKAVIPQSCNHSATCERETLLAALRRVAVLAHDRSRPVRFSFEADELTMDIRSSDRGEVTERIPIELEGEPISVGFNVRYVQDILSAVNSEHVRIELSEALGPARLVGVDDSQAYFVVMPMRLS